MATELATLETASLTRLLANLDNEAALDDEQFAPIAKFASAPCPKPEPATEHDVREVIAFLAGTLKAQRTSIEAGKIKLGAYRLALTGQPKASLTYAAQIAIRTLEWMPTPAELLRIVGEKVQPEAIAHAKATRLTRDRKQRIFEETLTMIALGKLSQDELAALPERTAATAETRGFILTMPDGTRRYRTPEAIAERENALATAQIKQFNP